MYVRSPGHLGTREQLNPRSDMPGHVGTTNATSVQPLPVPARAAHRRRAVARNERLLCGTRVTGHARPDLVYHHSDTPYAALQSCQAAASSRVVHDRVPIPLPPMRWPGTGPPPPGRATIYLSDRRINREALNGSCETTQHSLNHVKAHHTRSSANPPLHKAAVKCAPCTIQPAGHHKKSSTTIGGCLRERQVIIVYKIL
jgi:hypothetical protein